MTSAVEICARAFNAIEHRAFEDFADGSEEGAFAARHWDAARRFVLTAAPWNFAAEFGRVVAVEADAVAPAATPYVVTLAPDCLFFRNICDLDAAYVAIPFGDRRLRTSEPPPWVYEYTADVQEPHRFSPGFVETLVLYLSHLFAPRFTRSANRADIQFQKFEAALDTAAAIDATQGTVGDHRLGGYTFDWARAGQAQP